MKKISLTGIVAAFILLLTLNVSAQADWDYSCVNMGGKDVCNEFQECVGISMWNTSDYAGENCCNGTCITLSKEEAVERLSEQYGKDEAEFRADQYYTGPEEFEAEGGNLLEEAFSDLIGEEEESSRILVLALIMVALILILVILFIRHRKKRKIPAKIAVFIFIAVLSASFASAQDFSFAVISDTHTTPIKNPDTILNTNPDFIVHAGDFTLEDQFKFEDYEKLSKVPILPVKGNHDLNDAPGEYEQFWNDKKPADINFVDDSNWPEYYSFDYEGYHFVALDYTGVSLSRSLSNWLEKDLSGNQDKPTIILSHLPAISIDCGLHKHDRLNGLKGVIEANPHIKAVFSGHQHCYVKKTFSSGKILQVVAGTVSSNNIRYPRGDTEYERNLKNKHIFATVEVSADSLTVCGNVVETGDVFGCNGINLFQQVSLASLPLRKKIAQMIMSTPGPNGEFVEKYQVGGVILMKDNEGTGTVPHSQGAGGRASVQEITSRISSYQSKASIPLLVSSDIEGGRINRISHIYNPGAPRDMGNAQQIIQKMSEASKVMKDLGINMDLAPVVDVASDPDALMVKIDRSFSGDPSVVKQKSRAYIKGLHQNNVAATIKHFPGYGDESRNSDEERVAVLSLDQAELQVFNSLKPHTDAIMMSNIVYQNTDSENQAVVSPSIVQMARQNFNGVVISDDLGAVSIWDSPKYREDHKKLAVDAVEAGIDILLIVNYKKSDTQTEANIKTLIDGIEEAVNKGIITESRIDESVARIEALKKKYVADYQRTAPGPGIQFQNCQPGSFFGGGPLNVNVEAEPMVTLKEINGETVCAGKCEFKKPVSDALYSLNSVFRANNCQLKIVSVSASGDSITIDTSLCAPYEKRIKLACQAGWVNIHNNGAVFEYGTNSWKNAFSKKLCQWPEAASRAGENKEFEEGHLAIRFDQLEKEPEFDFEKSGAPESIPQSALNLKELNIFGRTRIIEADPQYFDIKTLSAKTIIEDIGGGTCSYCLINLKTAVERYPGLDFVAGVNGAFFGAREEGGEEWVKQGKILGWFVEDGELVKGPHDFAEEYFFVENNLPRILSEKDFKQMAVDNPSITSAVAGAKSASDIRPRTQVCVTPDYKVKLVTATSANVDELKDYLKANENCEKVVNLDGGGSTMHYYNWAGERQLTDGDGRKVANFVAVVPRTQTSYASRQLQPCLPGTLINYAGTSAKDEILFATYLIAGSFSTVLDYSLEPYRKVQDRMKNMIEDEEQCGETQTIDCFALQTAEDEDFHYFFKQNREYYFEEETPSSGGKIGWETYCENADEAFFSDFAEFYDTCLQAGENGYCVMEDFDPDYALESGNSITFTQVSEERYDMSLTGDENVFSLFTMENVVEFPSQIINEGGIKLVYQDERIGPLSRIVMNKNSGIISFSQEPMAGLPEHQAESQMIKVCAVSKDDNLKIETRNPTLERFEEVPLTIRFAFLPPNVPPPDVRGVESQSLIRARDLTVISWFRSPARNVVGYNVYKQDTSFPNQKSEDVKETANPEFINAQNEMAVKSITLVPECSPTGFKQCVFELEAQVEETEGAVATQNIRPREGMLVYESDTNRYYYIDSLAEGAEIYYGITAVNNRDLESVNILETPRGQSYDDVPPGYVEITRVPGETPEELTIEWKIPQLDIAGQPLDEEAVINFDGIISCQDGKEDTVPYGENTAILQSAIESNCELEGVIAKKLVKLPLQPVFTPDKINPYHPSDLEIINYLLE